MRLNLFVGKIAGLAAACSLLFGNACQRKHSATEHAAPSTGPETGMSDSQGSSIPIDSCLLGKWRSTDVSVTLNHRVADGGSSVFMLIEPTGKTAIDFSSMAPITANGQSDRLEYRYSGNLRTQFKSTGPGLIAGHNVDYSGLRVTASLTPNGAETLPIFSEKPITDWTQLGHGNFQGLTPGAGVSASEVARTIDASPIVTAQTYICDGATIHLTNGRINAKWTFVRVAQANP